MENPAPGIERGALFGATDIELESFLRHGLAAEFAGEETGQLAPMTMMQGMSEEAMLRGSTSGPSPDALAALEELAAAFERASPGGDLLAEYEADPRELDDLLTRLPASMADRIDTYRHRRDLFTTPTFLDGTPYEPDPSRTRREALAEWVVAPENPWYGQAIANRLIGQFLGTGLVDPVDDLTAGPDRVHPELLEFLGREFHRHDTDLRFLIGALVRTEAYGRSNSTAADEAERRKAQRWYGAHPTRPMTSPEFLDSVLEALLDPAMGERRGGRQRSGRVQNRRELAQRRLGQDLMGAFENDSSSLGGKATASISQALYLMNGLYARNFSMMARSRFGREFADRRRSAEERLTPVFLALLGRPPGADEAAAIFEKLEVHGRTANDALDDVVWAILNSTEFHTVH